MKRFTILGGVNGVGKSTLAGVLKAVSADFGTLVDADRLALRHGGNFEGGREAVELIHECISRGDDFTQETTLSGGKTARTIAEARENGYFVRLYYVALSSAEESLLRIKNRVRKGGHDIPEEVVRRRFAKRFDDLLRILPLVDEAYFFDNENGYVRVAEYRNGELILSGKGSPEWIITLKSNLENQK